MGNFGDVGALAVLGTLTFGLVTLARALYRKEKAAEDAPVTLSAQAGHIFEQYADLIARVSALEAEQKSTARRMNDLDDSVEHRFRRLNARAKREEPAAETESAPTLALPFPPPNGAVGQTRPGTGAFGRPFGPFRG